MSIAQEPMDKTPRELAFVTSLFSKTLIGDQTFVLWNTKVGTDRIINMISRHIPGAY